MKGTRKAEVHLNGVNSLSGDKLADAYIAVTDDLAFAVNFCKVQFDLSQ